MVRTYIRKSERRITNREIVIQAVRKVISDKCEKSEAITEFGILFYICYYYYYILLLFRIKIIKTLINFITMSFRLAWLAEKSKNPISNV